MRLPAGFHTWRREHETLGDLLYLFLFTITVALIVVALNALIFRTFHVVGGSMEPTLEQGDQLIINKVPVTWGKLTGQPWQPTRGQVIVFTNPMRDARGNEQHVIKRVIGLPGERVVVEDGKLTIFNQENPDGFQPDDNLSGPTSPTSGSVDRVVPDGELFVAGDNRDGQRSLDSRNGLSTVPLREIEGVAWVRFWPLNQWRGL